MNVEFFWQGAHVGATLVAADLLEGGAPVFVHLPARAPSNDDIHQHFRARTNDGRVFTLDVVTRQAPPSTDAATSVGGFLRRVR